ncbi:S-layer homology domain-containing protein [Patescibacteria group bacterium]
MKKFSILLLATVFAVTTATANAQLIEPLEPLESPMLISEPTPITYMPSFMTNYDAALAWSFENDVLKGDGATGDLREYDCVKRAELLKMLYNVLEVDVSNPNAELFSDTSADQWYVDYVKKAREKGTIAGYPDGTFKPGQCVNRAEAIKMALLEFPNVTPVGTPTQYTDVPDTEWFYPYVTYGIANDLVGTKHVIYFGDSKFFPGDSMARNEFAEMLYRLKAVQDNNLDGYSTDYAPENLDKMPAQDYDLEPEEFFEYGTSLLMTVDTHNQSQIDLVDGLLAATPAKSVDHYIGLLFESVEDEIAPAFDVGTEVMFAAGDATNGIPVESLLFTVDNPTKLEAAFDSLAKKPDFSKGNLFGFKTFDNRADGTFYAYTDEVMATWPTPGDRYLALQKIKNGDKNLLDNADFINYVKSIPSTNVGTIYFNSTYGESGMLAVVPHSSGVKFHYRLDGFDGLGGASEPPYMYEKIPGDNLMMYGESNALLDLLEGEGADLATQMQNEDIITTEGNWMNSGMAFSMHDTGSLIPGMALYFDAVGYVEEAKQDIAAMSEFFDAVIAQMDEESPEMTDVIVKDTVNADGATLNRITFDMNAIPEEELDSELREISSFISEPIEFYYGLTSDNYVVFALYNGFDEVLDSSGPISTNSDIKEALGYLSGYPNGLSYISMENMLTYVDMWVAEVEKTEPMPVEMKENYNQVMDYIGTVKYIISAEKEFGSGLMYVKVD